MLVPLGLHEVNQSLTWELGWGSSSFPPEALKLVLPSEQSQRLALLPACACLRAPHLWVLLHWTRSPP